MKIKIFNHTGSGAAPETPGILELPETQGLAGIPGILDIPETPGIRGILETQVVPAASAEQPVPDSHMPAEPAEEPASVPDSYRLPPGKWFFTFMCMNIPIAGWIYLLTKAYGKKENQLKDFARAYLMYKLVFLVLSLVILGLVVYVGLELADRVLAYMEML